MSSINRGVSSAAIGPLRGGPPFNRREETDRQCGVWSSADLSLFYKQLGNYSWRFQDFRPAQAQKSGWDQVSRYPPDRPSGARQWLCTRRDGTLGKWESSDETTRFWRTDDRARKRLRSGGVQVRPDHAWG